MENTNINSTSTKALRLAESLAREIEQVRYLPGTLLPTDRELAGRFDVSTNTVRKCLNILQSRGLVIREPQRGVVVANPGGLVAKLKKIAYISPLASPTAYEYLAGLTDALDYEQFIVTSYITHEDPAKYRTTIAYVAQQRPNGIVAWAPAAEYADSSWECLSQTRIPVVGIGSCPLPNITGDYVRDCAADAGTLIARYLIRRNIRDVAFLCTTSCNCHAERIEVIRREFAKVGASLPDDRIFLVDAPHRYERPADPHIDTQKFVAGLLDQGFQCQCMIFGHDDLAVGALRAIQKEGLLVPQEMKLISCGQSGTPAAAPLRLTTCYVDFAEQGRKAAEVLTRRISGFDGPPEVHYTPTTLIEGETT